MTLGNLFPRAVLCPHQLSGQYSKGIDEVLGPQTSKKKCILSVSLSFSLNSVRWAARLRERPGSVTPPGQVAKAGAFLS